MALNLEAFLATPPEIIFEWFDKETNARGWLVINSLKGGAAGGGTRMRKGLTKSEVVDLAKTMQIKFSVCGPPIGGAKSGIDFDPEDHRKAEVLRRWYKSIAPVLKTYYGTAGDLNVDEKKEVSPILEEYGIMHPQEGVLQGHFQYTPELKAKMLQRLRTGCELPVNSTPFSPKPGTSEYTIVDLITGYGVAESVRVYYDIYKKQNLKNKRIFIQGWGNVGAAAGWYLSQLGAKLIIIQDKEGYVINREGFSNAEVTRFINEKQHNTVHDASKIRDNFPDNLLSDLDIEIFIPAAASKLVKSNFIEGLINNGLQLISCGANVPFDEEAHVYGKLSRLIDQRVSLIPDFIANCGVARLFSYLMEDSGPVSEESIFQAITDTISGAIQKTYVTGGDLTGISRRFLNNIPGSD